MRKSGQYLFWIRFKRDSSSWEKYFVWISGEDEWPKGDMLTCLKLRRGHPYIAWSHFFSVIFYPPPTVYKVDLKIKNKDKQKLKVSDPDFNLNFTVEYWFPGNVPYKFMVPPPPLKCLRNIWMVPKEGVTVNLTRTGI